jgi:hypothetical protein
LHGADAAERGEFLGEDTMRKDTHRQRAELFALAALIRRMERAAVEARRAAGDMLGSEASTDAAQNHAHLLGQRLDVAYRWFFHAGLTLLACPVHGDAPTAGCVECEEMAQLRDDGAVVPREVLREVACG